MTETWEPRFTYHGFRFVEVTGLPGKPTLDTLAGRVVHDDLESVGKFACSNDLINQIYKNIVWGTSGNYRSLPTDCPQRDERQGWLGDRSEESKGESYLFDISALYSKWLQDMEDSQRESGSIPDVCPAHWPIYSDNVVWPSSSVIIPNMLHRQYGDQQIVARHYESAKKWIDYMLSFVRDGIIDRDSYGDWCVPPEDPTFIHSKDPARITDKALLATSYLYFDLRLMEKYANSLGKADDAKRFAKYAQQLATAFNQRFFKPELGQYDNGTQTSCVLPLRFGLVPADQTERVFEHLVDKIDARNSRPHRHRAGRRTVSQPGSVRPWPSRPFLHDRLAVRLSQLGLHDLPGGDHDLGALERQHRRTLDEFAQPRHAHRRPGDLVLRVPGRHRAG